MTFIYLCLRYKVWDPKTYIKIMVIPPWIFGLALSTYVVLMASDNIRSYECNLLNTIHPIYAAPVVALANLVLTVGIIVAYSIGIYDSIKTGKIRECFKSNGLYLIIQMSKTGFTGNDT